MPIYLSLLLFLVATGAFAQTPDPAMPNISAADLLLERLTRPGSRSLLVMDPSQASALMPPSMLDDPEVWKEWNTRFQTRRFGALTVIAPGKTSVYNTRLRPVSPADQELYADEYDLRHALLATFTKSQWQKAASPRGVGYGDFDRAQEKLWERVLPQPFAYKRRPASGEESLRRLSDDERRAVRFRLKLVSWVSAKFVQDGTPGRFLNGKQYPFKGNLDRATVLGPDAPEIVADAPHPKKHERSDEEGEWKYGQLVVAKAPHRPKPADIRLASLKGTVSLAPSDEKTPLTVGETVERIRKATGTEIYVHKRLAGFVVKGAALADGANYPAGNVLAAIAFAAEGTVRSLPTSESDDTPLYLLTRDREPLARQVARISEWLSPLKDRAGDNYERANKKITAQNPLPLLRFDADDSFAFPAAWRDRLNAAISADTLQKNNDGFEIRRDELSGEQQRIIAASVKQRNDLFTHEEGDYRISADRLWMSCSVQIVYQVPGDPYLGGEIGDRHLTFYRNWLPALAKIVENVPASPAGRAVLLSANSPDEAKQAVALCKTAKASAVWLRTDNPEVLTAATRDAGAGLPVLACLSLTDGTNAPANSPRDENLFGETIPSLLVPDDRRVLTWENRRLLYVAAVPGIAGVVFENILPPGYRGARADKRELNTWTGETDDTFSGEYSQWVQWGYPPAHRRGFLREHGVDPADLVVEEYTGIAEVDNKNQAFGRDEALWKAWLNGKRGRVISLLKAARVATGKLPVFLEGQTEFRSRAADRFDTVRWYAPWKPNAEPPLIDLYGGGWNVALPVPDVKSGTYLAVSSSETLTPASEITERTKRGETPGLTVIDWSHRTLAEVEAELKARPSATPPTAS